MENPDSPIAINDIARELTQGDILDRFYGPSREHEASKCLTKMGKNELSELDALRWLSKRPMGIRSEMHVLRLLSRKSPAEQEFGRAACRWTTETVFDPQKESETEISERARRVVSGEGDDTTLFWTFAPHVYRNLVHHMSCELAMRVIWGWARDGRRDIGGVHLPGLEYLNERHVSSFILDRDPQHVSHQYAAQEAPRIADLLSNQWIKEGPGQFELPEEEPRRVSDFIRSLIQKATQMGPTALDQFPSILSDLFWQHGQNNWWTIAIINDRFKNLNGFGTTEDEAKKAGHEGAIQGFEILKSMQGWKQRHEEAVGEGFRPYSGKELEAATNWMENRIGKPSGWIPLVDGIYTPTGKVIQDGVRWSGGEGGGRYCNIGEKEGDWKAPYVQVWNNSGFTQLPGWRFKVKDGTRA